MNSILIGAEGLDGANFLGDCLAMSNEVYFNNFTQREKVKYFFKEMSHIEKKNEVPIWSDVSMLFYSCARENDKLSFSAYQSKSIYDSHKSTKICISKVRLPVFWPLKIQMQKNSEDPLIKLLFESRYFIGLVNPDIFISLRTILGNSDSWDPDWKLWQSGPRMDEHLPNLGLLTIEGFNSLPIEVREIIKYKHQSDIERLFECNIPTNHKWHMSNMECDLDFVDIVKNEYKNIELYKEGNQLLKNKITHQWDCNWFLNTEDAVENIKILYSEMNLGKCNEDLICKMHKSWIRRIDYIKRSYIKSFDVTPININTFIDYT